MFYAQEILQKRSGKFGIIWLAATDPKLLTRRDYATVNINKICSDIIDHILHRISAATGKKSSRFSLYLSSKLMFGVIYVFKKQHGYLLDDTRMLQEGLYLMKPEIKKDETQLQVKYPTVTLDDPIRNNINPEFGRFSDETISLVAPSYEFFPVRTPRSSESSKSTNLIEEKPRKIQSSLEQAVSPITARVSEVTLPEPSIISLMEDLEFPGIKDLPPFEDLRPVTEVPISEEQVLIAVPMKTPSPRIVPREITPARFIPPIPSRPEKTVPLLPEETPVHDVQRQHRESRRRREVSGDFELQPPVRARKVPRRRLLIHDERTIISNEEFRNNILTSNKLLQSLSYASLQKPVDILFKEPGSRIGSSVLKKFWRNLKTFPELTDPAWAYTLEESTPETEEPSPLAAPLLEPPIVRVERSEEEIQIEMLRKKSLQEESALITTPASLKDISAIMQDISRKPSLGKSTSLPEGEIVPTMMPIEEEPIMEKEPVLEIEQEKVPLPEKPTCEIIISPVYTPPPPSPDIIKSPTHRDIFLIFKESLSEISPIAKLTFHMIISPIKYSRQYASKAFSRILDLHCFQLLDIKQDSPFGDIVISRGTNFY